MLTLVRGWIIDIVAISILGVVADLILPGGNVKKYVRFLIGVILLAVMLKPIFHMFNQMADLNKFIARNSAIMNMSGMNYNLQLNDYKQQDEIKNNFKKNLELHMEEQIKNQTGYKTVKANVYLSGSDENNRESLGIESVYIEIGNGNKENIRPVKIKIGDDSSVISNSQDNPEEKQKIKELISNIYGVSFDRIQVYYKPTDKTEHNSGQ